MRENMRILKILLLLLLIAFPFGEILRFNLGNNVFFKPLDGISILLLLCTTVIYLKEKKLRHYVKWYYFLFPIIGFISLLINFYWLSPKEIFTSFLYDLRWLSYMSILFAIVVVDNRFKKILIKFLIIDGLLILLIGYIQYFLYPSLKNLYYLGWDDHLYRMFSSFLDPNFAGTFFVLYLIFISGLLFYTVKDMQKKRIIFYGGVMAITLLAIFLTYSRSAMLMIIAFGLTFFLLIQKINFIIYLVGADSSFCYYCLTIFLYRKSQSL